jgi:hypothetical protein
VIGRVAAGSQGWVLGDRQAVRLVTVMRHGARYGRSTQEVRHAEPDQGDVGAALAAA